METNKHPQTIQFFPSLFLPFQTLPRRSPPPLTTQTLEVSFTSAAETFVLPSVRFRFPIRSLSLSLSNFSFCKYDHPITINQVPLPLTSPGRCIPSFVVEGSFRNLTIGSPSPTPPVYLPVDCNIPARYGSLYGKEIEQSTAYWVLRQGHIQGIT